MLSSSCKYGIRAVAYIASRSRDSEKIGIKQISEDLSLPTPFLAKILQLLARQKILSSSKGPHGGFSMLKDPQKVKLIDIVNTIDGQDVFTNCVMHNGSCQAGNAEQKKCPLHDDYENSRKELIKLFSNKTINDLIIDPEKAEQIMI